MTIVRKMVLRAWEVAAGVLLACVGVVLALGGAYGPGIVTVAVVVLVLAVRTQIRNDPDIAGGIALRRSTLELVQTAALGVILLTVLGTMVVALLAGWNHDHNGQTAIYALAGLEVLLLRELDRLGDSAMRWLIGGRAEREVGAGLEPLRAHGWLVAHDVLRDNRQNIDHVACGPSGCFAIETKNRQFVRRADLTQARGHAAWLKEQLNQGWVTAVLCLDGDVAPHEREQVWIVGRSNLRRWLENRRGRRSMCRRPGPRLAS